MRRFGLFCLLLAALLTGLAATRLLVELPEVRSQAAMGEFDATRAKARLATILGDERPHPSDSAGNDAVRARLIGQIRSIGLSPIVRDQFACNEFHKQRGVSCGRVRNVIVALGPASGDALLLNTHYDSNPSGPGAGDAGAGVATLLEVASILRRERLNRPVLFLFNEGEELGLVGARAFLSDPLSRRVDSLVNLEARGTTGPVTMFETSLPNGPPVRAYARSVERPYANSLTTDFYRQLPNYTDVNSFSERGWLTLNFAMIGNETRYHSAGDDLAALDPRTLQHMGDQTLAVTRDLAAAAPKGGGSLLFTDLAGRQLVYVPDWLGYGLFALLAAGFAWLSYRRGGMWRGLGVFAAGVVIAAALAWLALYLMGLVRDGSFWRGYPLWTHLAAYATGLLAGVAALALIGGRLTVPQLRASFWLGFLVLGAAVLVVAPGGIIYFLFPPLLALAGILASSRFDWAERAGTIAAALLLWLTLGELLTFLTELLSNGPLMVFAPLALLVAMPWLIEAKTIVDETGRGRAIAASLALAGIGWAVVAAAPAYSADRQARFAVNYVRDLSAQESWWAVDNSGASLPDALGSSWTREKLPHIKGKTWVHAAPDLAAVEPPQVELVGRENTGGKRSVTLRLRSNGSYRVALIAPEDAGIVAAGTGDYLRPISDDAAEDRYIISCSGRSCDGAELTLVTARDEPIELLVVGIRFALPPEARSIVSARPRDARPQYSPDQSVAMRRVRI